MVPGFHIYASNRMEWLITCLASMAGTGGKPPLSPYTILVQSKGMQRWISMSIAEINGICANIHFNFPNALLESVYAKLVGPLPENNLFDPPIMTLKIMEMLPALVERPEFEVLHRYLNHPTHPLKLYQLARQIADAFDQYTVYRPDILESWLKPHADREITSCAEWQAVLWRRLVSSSPGPYRSMLKKDLVRALGDPTSPVQDLFPTGLFVIGISHLPPFHLEVLQALARRIAVWLFVLNPCRHYWFDLVSDHRMIQMRARLASHSPSMEGMHLESGNRLLSSLGSMGQYFLDSAFQLESVQSEEYFDNPPTLLGRIQQDLLDLVNRAPGAERQSPLPENDGSIRIHSCHSPMREVEVLHDQLLDLLEKDPALEPRDILVMTPQIGLYSPYIHAVFGLTDAVGAKLPFSVADQSLAQESKVIDAFFGLMDLVGRRFEASRVLMLLESEAVYRQFGFVESELPLVAKWIQESGIRWGWNAAERRREHLPGYRENTWRHGLDRLLFGYATAPENSDLFSGLLPYGGIGAGEGPTLGRLLDFAQTLHASLEELSASDTLQGWAKRLHNVLTRMFKSDDGNTQDWQALKGVMNRLRLAGSSGADTTVTLEVIRKFLKDSLSAVSFDRGFISGGITFCAMLPMRSIPAKVICLIGMNHDAYPREQHEPGFSLMSYEPRKGDRSKRFDDRYLFLETLLCARQLFYISYVGQNIQDNSTIPPSVLVDELVEYIEENLWISGRELVVHHPLQAFSSSYYDGSNPQLFSYSTENLAASEEQLNEPGRSPVTFAEPLSDPGEDWRRCDWNTFSSFFVHPVRYFCEKRLGIFLREESPVLEDREHFTLNPLLRHKMRQQVLEGQLEGKSAEQIYSALRASGALPHGTVGKVICHQLDLETQRFLDKTATIISGRSARQEEVGLVLAPYALSGPIGHIYESARIVSRAAKIRPADLLKNYILHLALLAASGAGLPKKSIVICEDEQWVIEQVDKPLSVLAELLELYWQGLNHPLPFFQRTSYEFAYQTIVRRQNRRSALGIAAKKWQGNPFAPGESSDTYNMRCFGHSEGLAAEFEEIALRVYTPFFSAWRNIE